MYTRNKLTLGDEERTLWENRIHGVNKYYSRYFRIRENGMGYGSNHATEN